MKAMGVHAFSFLVMAVLTISLAGCGGTAKKEWIDPALNPDLHFTYIPALGSFRDLEGKITGRISPKELAVAVYIKVADGWWTKPSSTEPLTLPADDGTWICDITTREGDEQATEIVAYLVKRNTAPPLASGTTDLPSIPGSLDTEAAFR